MIASPTQSSSRALEKVLAHLKGVPPPGVVGQPVVLHTVVASPA
jgi:hypothetical protein